MYNIIIVDDKEVFRRKIKQMRYFNDTNNFKIEFEAQNGLKALEILEREKVDLVITDIRMPILDGIEVLKEVKSKNLCNCVILLSEYSDFSYAKEGIVHGAFDYIIKPIDNDKISTVLSRAKQYLDELSSKNKYILHEIEMIGRLILKKDRYALDLIQKVVSNIIEKNGELNDIIIVLSEIIDIIVFEIVKERTYITKFINLDELCKIGDIDNINDIKRKMYSIIEALLKEVNKFNLDTKSELINSMGTFILENIEKNISLQVLAEKYFMNKNYLSHSFKSESGKSFVDYVTFVKMEYARKMLSETDVKVYEIANKLGYKDTEYFSRTFKNYFNINPSEIRRKSSI